LPKLKVTHPGYHKPWQRGKYTVAQANGQDSNRRLLDQMRFIAEIDKAKGILRRSRIMDGSRRENDAEHSWHLAMMALVLVEHADESVDLLRVLKMLLLHDL